MQANKNFLNRSQQFWGYVRIISEKTGYSERGENAVKYIDTATIMKKLSELDITIDMDMLEDVTSYLNFRAEILNNDVQHQLMDATEAQTLYHQLLKIHQHNKFTCKLPLNKQKGDKKDYAFLTCIVNILTEQYLRNLAKSNGLVYGKDIMFDDDPTNLTYLKDQNNKVHGALSRRFDGAYPHTINPKAIWEIKEYYYTTTFGSRISDGVFETQLDGHEINDLSHIAEGDIKHIYFVDAYFCWWKLGKSYLCRIIDMLHMGLVDEVIFGKEVINRWEQVLDKIVTEHITV